MKTFQLKYGKTEIEVSIPKENLLGVIESQGVKEKKTEEEIINEALEFPIASPKLQDIVKPGEKICIVISDTTRAWQKMSIYLPYVVEKLNQAGIEDQDITFLCATGSHRRQTEEEHKVLLGQELALRFRVIDHESRNMESLKHIGTTSYGTPVHINKLALECDHLILTGAIIFHDLAGWGGGKKSILPGICGYESIMANHALSLNTNMGQGTHPMVRCGNIINNPLHEDMVEAANMVKPSFIFNVIMDDQGNIGGAVAGHYLKAHEVGCQMVDEMDGIYIKEQADLVIVSAGGYPKDIDLYQASKAISNAKEAVKSGGSMILVSECIEGVGYSEVQEMMENFESNIEREKFLRENFTVARYIGYLMAEIAEKFELIIITGMDSKPLEKINMKAVKDLNEALKLVYNRRGNHLKTYLMPYGANTLPKLL